MQIYVKVEEKVLSLEKFIAVAKGAREDLPPFWFIKNAFF